MRGPWEGRSGGEPAADLSFSETLIAGYQRILSATGGHRCRMAPSCSAYGREAFAAHGFVLGWLLTSDRLLRCGRDETRLSPEVLTEIGPRTLDPLSANDFWWARKARKKETKPPEKESGAWAPLP